MSNANGFLGDNGLNNDTNNSDAFIDEMAITNLAGSKISNIKTLSHIDISQACLREKRFEFLMDARAVMALSDSTYDSHCDEKLKITAKFFFSKNDNDILRGYGKFQNKFGISQKTRECMKVRLTVSGKLFLDCQSCCGEMSQDIDINEVYSLTAFFEDVDDLENADLDKSNNLGKNHNSDKSNNFNKNNNLDKNNYSDKYKNKDKDNVTMLEDKDLMQVQCPNNRLDLVYLSQQETLLSLDMVPKHEVCVL